MTDTIAETSDADLANEVRRLVAANESVERRAKRAADLIRTRTGHRWVGIYEVTSDEVRNLAWSGPAAPAYPSFPVDQGITSSAINSRCPVVVNDVRADSRYLTNQESTGSELIVPVSIDEDVVGTLDIEDARTNAFDQGEVTRFERLAAALADLYL